MDKATFAAGLPKEAYVVHPGPYDPGADFEVIRVLAGISGFYRVAGCGFKTREQAQAYADKMNGGALAPEVDEAMTCGSMFGWHVPAADPSRYVPGTREMKRS